MSEAMAMASGDSFDTFWYGRTVLVTGAGGFIGSHLAERLLAVGARVRALCHYNSNGDHGWLRSISARKHADLEIRLGDIRDSRYMEDVCEGVDTVFHLAALIAIPYSYAACESYVETNIRGTLNVLEAARRQGCRRIVQTSTSEVYGTPEVLPIVETHPLQGQSPYSASKIAADKLCEAYFSSFAVPVVTLRPFNTYGPRQSTRAVLPTLITQLIAGRKTVTLGRLDPQRDLTFVSDTVEGFLKAGAVDGIEGEVIQLGTGRTSSVRELFEIACRLLNVEARVVEETGRLRPTSSEVMVLLSDPSKAQTKLLWSPRVTLEEGIQKTAAWLRENAGLFDADRYHV